MSLNTSSPRLEIGGRRPNPGRRAKGPVDNRAARAVDRRSRAVGWETGTGGQAWAVDPKGHWATVPRGPSIVGLASWPGTGAGG